MLKTTGTSLISRVTATVEDVPTEKIRSSFAAAKPCTISAAFALLAPAFSIRNVVRGSAKPASFNVSRNPFIASM